VPRLFETGVGLTTPLDQLQDAAHKAARIWRNNARVDQRMPPGDWRVWLIVGDRGSGKTYAETLAALAALDGPKRNIGFVAPSLSAAKMVNLDGESGILAAVGGEENVGKVIRGQNDVYCIFNNGSQIEFRSSASPESIRGRNWDLCIWDEVIAAKHPLATWQQIQAATRKGRARVVIGTSWDADHPDKGKPRYEEAKAVLSSILKREGSGVIVTFMKSSDNTALSKEWLKENIGHTDLDNLLNVDPSAGFFRSPMFQYHRAMEDRIELGDKKVRYGRLYRFVVVHPVMQDDSPCILLHIGTFKSHGKRYIVILDEIREYMPAAMAVERGREVMKTLKANYVLYDAAHYFGPPETDPRFRLIKVPPPPHTAFPVQKALAEGRLWLQPEMKEDLLAYVPEGIESKRADRVIALSLATTEVDALDYRKTPPRVRPVWFRILKWLGVAYLTYNFFIFSFILMLLLLPFDFIAILLLIRMRKRKKAEVEKRMKTMGLI